MASTFLVRGMARWLIAAWAISHASSALALNISIEYDPSVANAANGPQIQNAVNYIVGLYQNRFSSPVTIYIFIEQASGVCGSPAKACSKVYPTPVSYSTYTQALQASASTHPQNTVLATAVANLGYGSGAGVSGASMSIVPAQQRVLGLTGAGNANNPDGIINLEPSASTYFAPVPGCLPNCTVPAGSIDGIAALMHEFTEVLGGGGQGSTLDCPSCNPANTFGSMDLYRYKGSHLPSFDPNDATAYFSINGGVSLADPTAIFRACPIDHNTGRGLTDCGDFTPCSIQGPVETCPGATYFTEFTGAPVQGIILQSLGYSPYPLAPNAVLPDTDGDGVPDLTDNCVNVANANQLDSNANGFGNPCDADLNNSGTVTATDFNLLRSCLNQPASASPLCAAADLNGSGTVTAADFALLKSYLNKSPGPSGRRATVAGGSVGFKVIGTASGLRGSGLILRNNGGDNLTLSNNGPFAFVTALASGAAYSVTVLTQPANPTQTCAVTAGSGSVGISALPNVAVSCNP